MLGRAGNLMRNTAISSSEQELAWSPGGLRDSLPEAAHVGLNADRTRTRRQAGAHGHREPSPNYVRVETHGTAHSASASDSTVCWLDPETDPSRSDFDSVTDTDPPAPPRRNDMEEKDGDPFHDSELGDVYDLYNACNGVLAGKLLDVSKLEELSREEAEVLDLDRLREVWAHTATCDTCEDIIRTLNLTRKLLKDECKALPEAEIKP